MTSDQKTLIPSLLNYINSDLFTLKNISQEITLAKERIVTDENNDQKAIMDKWNVIISYLPLRFYQIIESYPDIYTYEEFDKKYIRNPKMCAYDKYGTTNMWRPLMILNRCPTINRFNFEYIRHYDINLFTKILSILVSRVQNNEQQ